MRYLSSVFTVAKVRTHATKRCKRRHCRSYRLRDILSSISGFANADLYDDINSKSRRMNSYGLIKKYLVKLLCFASNISEMVRDIRVPFSQWPRARVALPNGANHVSVVVIVSEIWSRQHHEFRMLTCTTLRIQHPYECIRTANNTQLMTGHMSMKT